jgi:hypothetical protein
MVSCANPRGITNKATTTVIIETLILFITTYVFIVPNEPCFSRREYAAMNRPGKFCRRGQQGIQETASPSGVQLQGCNQDYRNANSRVSALSTHDIIFAL